MLFAYIYPASHVLRKTVRGIIVTTNRSGDRESPWKIPLLKDTVPTMMMMMMMVIIIIIIVLIKHSFWMACWSIP